MDTFTSQTLIDNEFSPVPPESVGGRFVSILSGRAKTTETEDIEVTSLIQREGRPAPSAGDDGPVSVTLRDGTGGAIETTTYPDTAVNTFQGVDSPSSATVTDEFMFAVGFPDNTAAVEIEYGDASTSFNPIVRSLQDRITRIPDAGFVDEPTRRRQELLDVLADLGDQIQQDEYEATAQTIGALRDRLDSSISDEYDPRAFQPSRNELQDLLADTERRISTIESDVTGDGLFFGLSMKEIVAGGVVVAGLAYLAVRMRRGEVE
jgi:hypothetical protein